MTISSREKPFGDCKTSVGKKRNGHLGHGEGPTKKNGLTRDTEESGTGEWEPEKTRWLRGE